MSLSPCGEEKSRYAGIEIWWRSWARRPDVPWCCAWKWLLVLPADSGHSQSFILCCVAGSSSPFNDKMCRVFCLCCSHSSFSTHYTHDCILRNSTSLCNPTKSCKWWAQYIWMIQKKLPGYMGITYSQDWSNINQVQVTSSATPLHIKQDPIILERKG